MPNMREPTDRFDDLPADVRRVGAHRAEQPRLRPGVVLLWAAAATIVLTGAGIFGTLVATGRVALFPATVPSVAPVETPDALVVDTSYSVLVLNATPQEGAGDAMRDLVIAAGWSEESVYAGDAGSEDFPATTVFYADPDDEGAARALAQAIGGAQLTLSDVYQPADDPDAEGEQKQLTIVVGLDRTTTAEPSP
ncbi:LytR C-terminal domain-containing protein [Microbacterium sp.]|uniref:LytR C-terminal domain-containing protein n=1 Tax=Microbacterium sp. TaxID=51671 RepID=UPI0039E281AE